MAYLNGKYIGLNSVRGVTNVSVDEVITEGSKNAIESNAVYLFKQDVYNKLGDGLKALVLDIVHPVGCLYWSSNATNPGELFGGTWTQIKDKFILAAGDTYKAGQTGGEAAHTLTVDEMPAHKHVQRMDNAKGAVVTAGSDAGDGATSGGQWIDSSVLHWLNTTKQLTTMAAGGDAAHNNMPPYEVFYCWQRTA